MMSPVMTADVKFCDNAFVKTFLADYEKLMSRNTLNWREAVVFLLENVGFFGAPFLSREVSIERLNVYAAARRGIIGKWSFVATQTVDPLVLLRTKTPTEVAAMAGFQCGQAAKNISVRMAEVVDRLGRSRLIHQYLRGPSEEQESVYPAYVKNQMIIENSWKSFVLLTPPRIPLDRKNVLLLLDSITLFGIDAVVDDDVAQSAMGLCWSGNNVSQQTITSYSWACSEGWQDMRAKINFFFEM